MRMLPNDAKSRAREGDVVGIAATPGMGGADAERTGGPGEKSDDMAEGEGDTAPWEFKDGSVADLREQTSHRDDCGPAARVRRMLG